MARKPHEIIWIDCTDPGEFILRLSEGYDAIFENQQNLMEIIKKLLAEIETLRG